MWVDALIFGVGLWFSVAITGLWFFRYDFSDKHQDRKHKLWLLAAILGWPATACWIAWLVLTDSDKFD